MEKKKVIVSVGPKGAAVDNPQWTRVHGPDIQPQHKFRADLNQARMNDQNFKNACEAAGVKVTRRQAGKWNNKKGAAYNVANRVDMTGFIYPEATA